MRTKLTAKRIIFASTAAVAIVVAAPAWASAVDVLPDGSGFVGACSTNPSQCSSASTGTPLVADVANAQIGVFATPDVNIMGNVSGNGSTANGHFTYYFGVDGNVQYPYLVTVDIQTDLQTLASGGSANAYIYGDSNLLEHVCSGSSCSTQSSAFDGTLQFQFDALNEPHSIYLDLELSSSGSAGFANGSIDPFITIDPITPDAADLSLVFSPNVANALPPSATPLPAALPLFAGGLGAIGLLGWRRKRKTADLVAA